MTDHDLLLQIVHKLDHMATKEDIVNFATKDDLRASIDEVKAEFNDKLSNFATKDDLKEAIEDAKSELYDEIVLCEKDIDEIKEQMSFFKAAKLEYDNQILFTKNYLIWRPVWKSWKHRPVNPSCM